jgi:Tol biopolymer transport system component
MVVYRSQPELTKFGLQVVTLGEEAPVTLIESDSEAYYSPVWSPDGKQIAFVVDVQGPAAHVYVMDANGENVKPVTTEALNFISSVVWTPDGTHLIFNAIEEEQGFRGIYVINVDGSGLTYLAGLPNVDLSELRLVPEGYITELPTETISIQP